MISITMVRENGAPVPQYELPEGFSIVSLGVNEGQKWDEALLSAGFSQRDIDGVFEREFAPYPNEFDRVLMLKDDRSGEYIGTISAWFDNVFQGGGWGRIHWVGLSEAYQGRGLANPLMSAAMNILVARHERSMLVTQPFRLKAINMYLKYGFDPFVCSEEEMEGWREVETALGRKLNIHRP